MSIDPDNMQPVEAIRLAGRIRRIFGIDKIVEYLQHLTHRFNQLERKTMTAFDDLQQSVTDLKTAASAEIQAVSDKVTALQATIDALKAAGTGASDAQLADLKSQVDGIKTSLTNETGTLNPAPAPVPTPAA